MIKYQDQIKMKCGQQKYWLISLSTLYSLPSTLAGKRKGNLSSFTLLEILIASAIFTAIVILTIGAFTGSISFNSTATEDRISRQAIRSFNDWLTMQIRQNSAEPISIAQNQWQAAYNFQYSTGNYNPATTKYSAYGFTFVSQTTNANFTLSDPASVSGVPGVIMPRSDGTFMYIGTCGTEVPAVRITVNVVTDVPLDPCNNTSDWRSAAAIFPPEVKVSALQFWGITPKRVEFCQVGDTGCTPGAIKSYGALAQPYLSWRMEVSPSRDEQTKYAFQSTITLRDYTFAFPACTVGACQ